jgi:hypothetical protein
MNKFIILFLSLISTSHLYGDNNSSFFAWGASAETRNETTGNPAANNSSFFAWGVLPPEPINLVSYSNQDTSDLRYTPGHLAKDQEGNVKFFKSPIEYYNKNYGPLLFLHNHFTHDWREKIIEKLTSQIENNNPKIKINSYFFSQEFIKYKLPWQLNTKPNDDYLQVTKLFKQTYNNTSLKHRKNTVNSTDYKTFLNNSDLLKDYVTYTYGPHINSKLHEFSVNPNVHFKDHSLLHKMRRHSHIIAQLYGYNFLVWTKNNNPTPSLRWQQAANQHTRLTEAYIWDLSKPIYHVYYDPSQQRHPYALLTPRQGEKASLMSIYQNLSWTSFKDRVQQQNISRPTNDDLPIWPQTYKYRPITGERRPIENNIIEFHNKPLDNFTYKFKKRNVIHDGTCGFYSLLGDHDEYNYKPQIPEWRQGPVGKLLNVLKDKSHPLHNATKTAAILLLNENYNYGEIPEDFTTQNDNAITSFTNSWQSSDDQENFLATEDNYALLSKFLKHKYLNYSGSGYSYLTASLNIVNSLQVPGEPKLDAIIAKLYGYNLMIWGTNPQYNRSRQQMEQGPKILKAAYIWDISRPIRHVYHYSIYFETLYPANRETAEQIQKLASKYAEDNKIFDAYNWLLP